MSVTIQDADGFLFIGSMAYKVPNNIKRASKLLLLYIVENNGGQSAVARKCGISRQLVKKYMDQGYVPLVHVYDVSNALEREVSELSYVKMLEIFGESYGEFPPSIIGCSILTDKQKEAVLKIYNKK